MQSGRHSGSALFAGLASVHDIGGQVPVSRLGKCLHCGQAGPALHAKSRCIPRAALPVVLPHRVHIPPIPAVGVIEAPSAGRAGGPVASIRVHLFQRLWNQVFEQPDMVCLLSGGTPLLFHLAAAAPQGDARMMTHPPDVVLHLRSHLPGKGWGQRVGFLGEHEVLPHQKPQFITDIIEKVLGITPAAPHPDAVEMSGGAVLQKPPGTGGRHPGQQAVLREISRSHGENFHSVNLVDKGFPKLVLLHQQPGGTQAGPPFPAVQHPAFSLGPDPHRI